jgi:hypothetical protein
MKEGFDGSPIGVRITRHDMRNLRYLARTMFPGLSLTLSDVSRLLMREAMLSRGLMTPRSDWTNQNTKRAVSG